MWGFPFHLWTIEVFSAIGKICGGLCLVNSGSSSSEELRWAWLELMEGDVRNILYLLVVTN